MAANNIALMPLQREGGVDSYLSALAQGQQLKQQRDAGQRAQAQESRAQTDFDMQRKLQAVDQLGAALDGIQDGDAQGFERVKAFAVQNGLIDPNEAQRYTVEQLPQIRALSQRARTIAKERQQAEMQGKEFDLKRRATEADINQSYAAARASNAAAARGSQGGMQNAPAHYQWVRGEDGAVSLAPIPGGAADPNKIAPGEGVKVRASNAQLDALEQSLESYIKDLEKTSSFGRIVSRGPEVSKVETGHTDLLMQMKNLYELGVLNGPDYFLMTKIVEDPTSLIQLARGTGGLKAQTDTVKSIIARSRNINNAKLGLPQAPAGAPPSAPPGAGDMPRPRSPQERDALPPGTRYMAPDGTIKVKR